MDPRIVMHPRQAQELLTAVTCAGRRGRGRRLMALSACMYYDALRQGEAVALRRENCDLPVTGLGRLLIDVSRPAVNTQWTDTGDAHEERGRDDVPPAPIPPALAEILRHHIAEFRVEAE
ncbi:hypothetical protein [Nonomuraea angiospora]